MDKKREQLEEQLQEVKEQIQVLDMIEERLLEMRELLYQLVKQDENHPEAEKLRKEIKNLEEQINLLGKETNEQS